MPRGGRKVHLLKDFVVERGDLSAPPALLAPSVLIVSDGICVAAFEDGIRGAASRLQSNTSV